MTLSEQLAAMQAEMKHKVPDVAHAIMERANETLIRSGIGQRCLKEGDKAPDFTLPNSAGQPIGLADLLALGPLVVSFYRGSWCTFCNVELRALQAAQPAITALGGSIVAISPQTLDHSRKTITQAELSYPVLSDEANSVARSFGLVFELPEELRSVYESFGINLPEFNGNPTFELPIPATYLLDTDRTILKSLADPDYTRRLEPADIVAALKARAAR